LTRADSLHRIRKIAALKPNQVELRQADHAGTRQDADAEILSGAAGGAGCVVIHERVDGWPNRKRDTRVHNDRDAPWGGPAARVRLQ